MSKDSTVSPRRGGYRGPSTSAIKCYMGQEPSSSLRQSITNSLLSAAEGAICLGLRLSLVSTTSLMLLWRLLGRQPALIDKTFYRLLLMKVELEGRVTDFSQLVYGVAAFNLAPELLKLEKPSGRQGHNGVSAGEAAVDNEEISVVSELSYYIVSPMPNIIGIVRYHAKDDHDRTVGVGEDMFFDSPEEFCRLEREVEEALLSGIDVCVASDHDPDLFPEINKYLTEGNEF